VKGLLFIACENKKLHHCQINPLVLKMLKKKITAQKQNITNSHQQLLHDAQLVLANLKQLLY
jgi:hypothetical protein